MSAISSSTGESCSCNPQNIYMLNLTYMNFGHGYYFFFFDFLSSSSSSFFFKTTTDPTSYTGFGPFMVRFFSSSLSNTFSPSLLPSSVLTLSLCPLALLLLFLSLSLFCSHHSLVLILSLITTLQHLNIFFKVKMVMRLSPLCSNRFKEKRELWCVLLLLHFVVSFSLFGGGGLLSRSS